MQTRVVILPRQARLRGRPSVVTPPHRAILRPMWLGWAASMLWPAPTIAPGRLDDGLIKKLATLRTEIEETNQRTKDLASSIFSEDVLERQLASAQMWERMAAAAKEIHDA